MNKVVIAICLWLCVWGSKASAASSAEALLAQVAANSKATVSLQANFKQEKYLNMLQDRLQSTGHFCVHRQNSRPVIFWEYTAPLVSGFKYIGGQGELWMDGRQSTRKLAGPEARLLQAMAEHIEAWTAIDPKRLARLYKLEQIPMQRPALRLVPKKTGGIFTALTVIFDPSLRFICELHFHEASGDKTMLYFQDIKLNADLSAQCLP